MARSHHESAIFSFAKDIHEAGELRGRTPGYWLQTGLCTSAEEVTTLFETIDTFFAEAKKKGQTASSLAELAYTTHGRLLNVLSNLHGDEAQEFPDLPDAPSFQSKHADFRHYRAPPKPKHRRRSAKSKGKQKAKTPTPVSSDQEVGSAEFSGADDEEGGGSDVESEEPEEELELLSEGDNDSLV